MSVVDPDLLHLSIMTYGMLVFVCSCLLRVCDGKLLDELCCIRDRTSINVEEGKGEFSVQTER